MDRPNSAPSASAEVSRDTDTARGAIYGALLGDAAGAPKFSIEIFSASEGSFAEWPHHPALTAVV